MKLHEDKFAFLNIINLIHEDSSIRADILEKDYYVTLLLRELAGKQVTLPAYFKGGTALYKAQKSIRRFSEDIDLTVCIDNCSNSQAKKRLEMATKKYQALPRTSRKDLEDDRKGSITTVYDYTPLVGIDTDDPLQRFGYVKVEGTSFTVSEPFTPLEIEPILYTYATEEQRNILRSQYDVVPFMINTIRLERIFADKIFAAEFYYERKVICSVCQKVLTENEAHTYANGFCACGEPEPASPGPNPGGDDGGNPGGDDGGNTPGGDDGGDDSGSGGAGGDPGGGSDSGDDGSGDTGGEG